MILTFESSCLCLPLLGSQAWTIIASFMQGILFRPRACTQQARQLTNQLDKTTNWFLNFPCTSTLESQNWPCELATALWCDWEASPGLLSQLVTLSSGMPQFQNSPPSLASATEAGHVCLWDSWHSLNKKPINYSTFQKKIIFGDTNTKFIHLFTWRCRIYFCKIIIAKTPEY